MAGSARNSGSTDRPVDYQSVLSSLPRSERREETFRIMLGDYIDGNPYWITYRPMRAAILFGEVIPANIEHLKRQGCREEEPVMMEMAILMSCHAEPPAGSAADLAILYTRLFQVLTEAQKVAYMQEFKERGGAEFLQQMQELIDRKKKATSDHKPDTKP